ncbi:NADPH-dependent assimilatory sulfite reductase hemoprotein subunit [Elongatibacter sediminis]|uniref:assimilatory sulfite reductase (NADPH) n=1 Tax=Elongatibacter sediminis TaxID=3119006 RepID=A0AAW9RB76_9GAMM
MSNANNLTTLKHGEGSPVEGIKLRSDYLRGTLTEGLADSATGALAEDDTQLSKFHGFYQQDNRDFRDERRRQMLEPDYQFMIRARLPGGICSPAQWLGLDQVARTYANGSLRITTRQSFQFHGVIKRELKATIRAINDSMLDTVSACGDVNRNVMATALPESSSLHRRVCADAAAVGEHLLPRTTAYHEIWLGRERVAGTSGQDEEVEPIYGRTYLPRKFKIAFAIPPRNDVDVYAHDLGFVAHVEDDEVVGYNVTVGGGMGVTHGDPETYPRLADVVGYCTPGQLIETAETIVGIQRDFGDRVERKHARLKYTLAERGVEWLLEEFKSRAGFSLAEPRPFSFTHTGDLLGWQRTDDGLWHLALFIENGRVADVESISGLAGMRAVAHLLEEKGRGEFRLTPNQNVIISAVEEGDREAIDAVVAEHGLDGWRQSSPLRLNSMACVGFPTCGLAMAESERYLPDLVTRIDALLEKHGLSDQPITIRMTGCPNGCARPYLAEIGLVGKGPGLYNLHVGAAFDGSRLNAMVRESLHEQDVLDVLDGLFADYAGSRRDGEAFGNYLHRTGAMELP